MLVSGEFGVVEVFHIPLLDLFEIFLEVGFGLVPADAHFFHQIFTG